MARLAFKSSPGVISSFQNLTMNSTLSAAAPAACASAARDERATRGNLKDFHSKTWYGVSTPSNACLWVSKHRNPPWLLPSCRTPCAASNMQDSLRSPLFGELQEAVGFKHGSCKACGHLSTQQGGACQQVWTALYGWPLKASKQATKKTLLVGSHWRVCWSPLFHGLDLLEVLFMADHPSAVGLTGHVGTAVFKRFILLPRSEVEHCFDLFLHMLVGLRLKISTSQHVVDVKT